MKGAETERSVLKMLKAESFGHHCLLFLCFGLQLNTASCNKFICRSQGHKHDPPPFAHEHPRYVHLKLI